LEEGRIFTHDEEGEEDDVTVSSALVESTDKSFFASEGIGSSDDSASDLEAGNLSFSSAAEASVTVTNAEDLDVTVRKRDISHPLSNEAGKRSWALFGIICIRIAFRVGGIVVAVLRSISRDEPANTVTSAVAPNATRTRMPPTPTPVPKRYV
jgi:hypothetical protein